MYREKLKSVLNNVLDLALTADMWKNKHPTYYFGLTVHFFDENFNYISLIIGFRKFMSRHLSVKISNFIKYELNKLEILKQIVAITSDNGSDIKAACNKDFGVRFSCFCHNLNLTVKAVITKRVIFNPFNFIQKMLIFFLLNRKNVKTPNQILILQKLKMKLKMKLKKKIQI